MGVDRMLQVAASQIGVTEIPPNSNRTLYGLWAVQNGHPQGQGVPWCDVFVSWCADHAGLSSVIPYSAYVPTRLAGAQGDKTADRRPARGALACFDWNGDGDPDHIGIVEQVNQDGSLTTIEGNTSPSDAGSQSNGGGVYRRRRQVRYVQAFIHPPYPEEDMPLTPDEITAVANAAMKAVWTAGWPTGQTDPTGKPVTISAAQRLAAAASAPTALDIAHAVASLIPPGQTGAPIDVHALASAVADELARRLQT